MRDQGDSSYTLEDLGIVKRKDNGGNSFLTIDIDGTTTDNSELSRIYFDDQARRWRPLYSSSTPTDYADTTALKQNGLHSQTLRLNHEVPKWVDVIHIDQACHILAVDWSETDLGTFDRWPLSLQSYLKVVFLDTQPAALYWGPEFMSFYNSEYVKVAEAVFGRSEFPMGEKFAKTFPEIALEYLPFFRHVMTSKVAVETPRRSMLLPRDGGLVETFYKITFFPLSDECGGDGGVYLRASEITAEVIAEGRTKTLNGVAAIQPDTTKGVLQEVMNILQDNESDFPVALAYSAHDNNGKYRLNLVGSFSSPEYREYSTAPVEIDLDGGQSSLHSYIRKAKASLNPVIVHGLEAKRLVSPSEDSKEQGSDSLLGSVAIIPLQTPVSFVGVLIHGLNPRRPLDDVYHGFLNNLMKQVSASVGSAKAKLESERRTEVLTKQLERSEKQIRDLAEYGPVGLCRMDMQGKITWANNKYFELTGHSKNEEDLYDLSFRGYAYSEDVEIVENAWNAIVDQHTNVNIAIRLSTRSWCPPVSADGQVPREEPAWVQISGFPVFDSETGDATAVAAAVTDISRYKWAEAIQARNATTAREAKSLQEKFIDMVSHEMRNPLSAITQLCEAISTDLTGFNPLEQSTAEAQHIIDQNVEHAKTILLCAVHQKRILDDVLTLSRLDASLLSIVPVLVDPIDVVESSLRMFNGEFIEHGIAVELVKEDSYHGCGVSYMTLDPSRLTQVFINLITNAIKFTKLERVKKIKITISAHKTRPVSLDSVTWFSTGKALEDHLHGPEWGDGEIMYLCFQVEDTGCGLEPLEMANLFSRFQQATSKTHIKYGGSGLGLFIARELTETQGGEIGCRSAKGEGTVFAFYIKGRKADKPEEAEVLPPESHRRSLQDLTDRTRQKLSPRKRQSDSCQGSGDNKLTVLMVEDNIVNVKILKKQLEQVNCAVYVTNNGQEALDRLEKSTFRNSELTKPDWPDFDVVLMDIEMPVMDGLTCTQRIRELQESGTFTKHIPIIAITANARGEQQAQILQAGADRVLTKPFRAQDCLDTIHQTIEAVGQLRTNTLAA